MFKALKTLERLGFWEVILLAVLGLVIVSSLWWYLPLTKPEPSNFVISEATVENGSFSCNVIAQANNPGEFGHVIAPVVEPLDDKPVYIRDIANVLEGPSELDNIVSFYGGVAANDGTEAVMGASAVTIAIAKKEGSNGVDVANAILAKLEVLKARMVPDNVNVTVTRNYGKTANDKVN